MKKFIKVIISIIAIVDVFATGFACGVINTASSVVANRGVKTKVTKKEI